MKEYIDLSFPIEKHWRWLYHKTFDRDYLMGGPLREEIIYMAIHCFTHIDPPGHIGSEGATIDQIPLSDLIGMAKVLDFSAKEECAEITWEDMEEKGQRVRQGDIVLVKTCHALRYGLEQQDFWMRSPYMSENAGQWLVDRGVRAVGFDFPQDYVLREFFIGKIPPIEKMPMHNTLLRHNILQIEYLSNLHLITEEEIMIYAIPLRFKGVAGSPARVFAVRDT